MKCRASAGIVRPVMVGWRFSRGVRALACALVLLLGSSIAGARARWQAPAESLAGGWVDAHQPLTATTWVSHYVLENRRVALDEGALRQVLELFRRPWVAGWTDSGWFARGRYGARLQLPRWSLSWNNAACDSAPDPLTVDLVPWSSLEANGATPLGPLDANSGLHGFGQWTFTRPSTIRLSDPALGVMLAPEPDALAIQPIRHCPPHRAPRAVTLIRTDGEHDRLSLLDCNGSVSADSLDRVSTLLRPFGVSRPELPLPSEPEASIPGEWVDGVKLAHPRLVWALQRIAQAFPFKAIYIVSGYRRESHGYHPRGRAADLFVHGVDNTILFEFCRTLNDVGCGYYPNNKFVHVDVRELGTKHPSWVDIAHPGHPSEYVDRWPGIGSLNTAGSVSH